MRKLAEVCYRRRRYIVLGWIVLLVGLFAISNAVKGEYNTKFEFPDSESRRALDLLRDRGVTERTGFGGQIVFRAEQGVADPAVRSSMDDFFAAIEGVLEGELLVSPYAPGHEYQISADGKVAYADLNFSERSNTELAADGRAVRDLWQGLTPVPGLQVELGGDIFVDQPEFSNELLGIGAAVVILLIAFGSVVAMGLPVVTALFGIGCGVAILGFMTRVFDLPDFTGAMAAMIGIGVGIDYALIVVSRYRQALRDGLTPDRAVGLAVDTAGRAVLFAGVTVVISLLGILLMNLDFMRAVAIAAVSAVAMTMLAALTLLPALLGFAGKNIDRLRVPILGSAVKDEDPARSFWFRWSRMIQARPWVALIVGVAALLLLAFPIVGLRLGFPDAGNRLESDTTRRAYDLLADGFGIGVNGPILVLVDTPGGAADQAAVQQVVDGLRQTQGVAAVAGPQVVPNANLSIVTVFPTSAFQDEETTDLVHRLRDQTIPAVKQTTGLSTIYTAGGPPGIVDFSDYMAKRLPYFMGAVLILSFILLLVVFHSVVVPVKAVLMNLLSIGAAFGVTVAVFQWGIGASLIGIKEGPVDAWVPMMLFAIVFGLSMDYEVFLLTRVREEYDRTGDNRRAVADGLAATGRVISAAAAIMVCVFASFILGADRSLKLFGFGLAAAIFIDATLVRLLLVPAAMELMGKANWWAPRWLARRLPTIRVEPAVPPATPSGVPGS
jgi:RND superfamily putative drug exporter